MAIPLSPKEDGGKSLLRSTEHGLHPWVAFGILPLFGFANAGVSFEGLDLYSFLDPLQLGIALGLLVGKQAGIFAAFWLMISRGWAKMPEGASWRQLYGLAVLCGIGFTMSLFIGGLAWQHEDYADKIRLGVIVGSLASAALGSLLLLTAKPRRVADEDPRIRNSG
jgi:NhaA family Na+:H+ antiporter